MGGLLASDLGSQGVHLSITDGSLTAHQRNGLVAILRPLLAHYTGGDEPEPDLVFFNFTTHFTLTLAPTPAQQRLGSHLAGYLGAEQLGVD